MRRQAEACNKALFLEHKRKMVEIVKEQSVNESKALMAMV